MKKCWIIMLIAVVALMAGCGQISDDAETAAAGAKINTVSEDDTVKSLGTLPETDSGRLNVTDKRADTSKPVEGSQINSESNKQNTAASKSQFESKANTSSALSSQILSGNSTQVTADSNPNTVSMTNETAAAVESDNDFNIFGKLNSLNYKPITCDGLPEYDLKASDGTVYSINLTDKWVWNSRKGDMEATLPDELVSWLNTNGQSVGLKISEYAAIDDKSQREVSSPSNTVETDSDFNIFEKLNSLNYRPITCDGLPEYDLKAPDGSTYFINLTDKWVWSSRKGDMEANLPDELVSWLNANGQSVGLKISEYAAIDDESQREVSSPSNTVETDSDFNIFGKLNLLDYKQTTCDGLPEYELKAPDGTVYSINLTDKWVWSSRKGDMEATLPDELVSWLNTNGQSVGLKIS